MKGKSTTSDLVEETLIFVFLRIMTPIENIKNKFIRVKRKILIRARVKISNYLNGLVRNIEESFLKQNLA